MNQIRRKNGKSKMAAGDRQEPGMSKGEDKYIQWRNNEEASEEKKW